MSLLGIRNLPIILAVTVSLSFTGGWIIRGWYEDSLQKHKLEKLQQVTEKAQQKAELYAQEANKEARKRIKEVEDEHSRIQEGIQQSDDLGCLSPSAAELHHDIVSAVSNSNPSRMGCD